MISELQIQNFKCFQQARVFEFSKLNLLTGINGRGKSSLLQVLLLLSQSSKKLDGISELILNDEFVKLGNFDDVKNSDTPRTEPVVFNIKASGRSFKEVKFEFKENFNDEFILDAKEINFKIDNDFQILKNNSIGSSIAEIDLSNLLEEMHFVSADRLGPIKFIEKRSLPEFIYVGTKGENTINILANYNNDLIPPIYQKLYLGNDAPHLLQQTTEWLAYILEGAKIKIEGQEKSSSVLTMLLNNKSNSNNYKQANVGYGYSYILPLIVTGLIAEAGQTIIIENPEAHLHPRAQSRIAEFFARVAACGVQVFIESHSEHILNGLRVGALNPQIEIKHDELAIHYFNESFDSEKLSMDEKGKIPNWPHGFFDQQEVDFANIFKFTK